MVSRLDLTEPTTQSVLVAAAAGTRREADGVVPQADEPAVDAERGWRLGTLLQLTTDGPAGGDDDGQGAPSLLVLQQLLLKGMLHPATELPTAKVRHRSAFASRKHRYP